MPFPSSASELELHDRLLAGERTATAEVFSAYAEPVARAVVRCLGVSLDPVAYDSAVDAIFDYLGEPSRFDPAKARLSTYLVGVARRRAIDRLRTDTAREAREKIFSLAVELSAPAPNEGMERNALARELWKSVETALPDARDLRTLGLILQGERSTDVLAQALNLGHLPETARRIQVKQHRDRILKVLERLGAAHADS